MTLIASISGIRGTIGGNIGNNLTPLDICEFCLAYGKLLSDIDLTTKKNKLVVVGYDGRCSKDFVLHTVVGTLLSLGFDIINIEMTTTPTMEMAIPYYNALGGIMISASHNPMQWNALKLFNHNGEFLTPEQAQKVIDFYNKKDFPEFPTVNKLGKILNFSAGNEAKNYHIDKILELKLVKPELIKEKNFKIVVDVVNSSGSKFVPDLLKKLGVKNVKVLNSITEEQIPDNCKFPHNPEPLPENLTQLIEEVKKEQADLGIAVDPDVDRLALITNTGEPFGEEYTLVAVADYILKHTPGPTVSNLSSSQALRILTEEKYNQKYYASAVGEINVVGKMKEVNAVIGGEGNGGVIYPGLHYGRDALVGIALLLSYLAEENISLQELKNQYPQFVMIKDKIRIEDKNPEEVLKKIRENNPFPEAEINTIDGVKFIFPKKWIHIRKSNTEPIIRIYVEAETENIAKELISKIKELV